MTSGISTEAPRARPGLQKTVDAFFAIFIDNPQNATLGNSKGLDDPYLFTGSLDAELCGEYAKGSQITFSMLEHGLRAPKIEPLSVLSHNADHIIDASSMLRNQRQ